MQVGLPLSFLSSQGSQLSSALFPLPSNSLPETTASLVSAQLPYFIGFSNLSSGYIFRFMTVEQGTAGRVSKVSESRPSYTATLDMTLPIDSGIEMGLFASPVKEMPKL